MASTPPDSTTDIQDDDSAQGLDTQSKVAVLPPASDTAMEEYYRLQQNLLICTLIFSAFIYVSVWIAYSLHIALNYLIGACAGVVYLRMLGKNVASIGRGQARAGSGRLAVFVGLILVATQWQQLEVVPVFLGFLTYKAALIAYTLWTATLPGQYSD